VVLPGFTTPEEVWVSALVELLKGTPERHQTETDDGGKSRRRTPIVPEKFAVAVDQRQGNGYGNICACKSSLWWWRTCATMFV